MFESLNNAEVFPSLDVFFHDHGIGQDELKTTKLGGFLCPVQPGGLQEGMLVTVLSSPDFASANVVAIYQVHQTYPNIIVVMVGENDGPFSERLSANMFISTTLSVQPLVLNKLGYEFIQAAQKKEERG